MKPSLHKFTPEPPRQTSVRLDRAKLDIAFAMDAVCADNQLSCMVHRDSLDMQMLYHFRSFSDRLAKISWMDGENIRFVYLEPNTSVTIKIRDSYMSHRDNNVPVIQMINGGLG